MRQVSPPADMAVVRPELSAPADGTNGPLIFVPPTYTMRDIHAAIPPHCFHPNTLISLSYVLRDFSFAFTLAFLATYIRYIPSPSLRIIAWGTYQFAQGLAFTGLWELAHECGHGALSKHKSFNNYVGLTIHSLLLVPYHSWRFTHQTHHKNTNNLSTDIAFVPPLKSEYLTAQAANPFSRLPFWELIEDTPVVTLITLFFHQLIAFPIYLTLNNFALERMRKVEWWKRSHFYFGGDGPNFRPWQSNEILISDCGIAAALVLLWAAVGYFGSWNVLLWYGVPYLWVNHWICKSSLLLVVLFLRSPDLT
jgi:fatty acid desaturase